VEAQIIAYVEASKKQHLSIQTKNNLFEYFED